MSTFYFLTTRFSKKKISLSLVFLLYLIFPVSPRSEDAETRFSLNTAQDKQKFIEFMFHNLIDDTLMQVEEQVLLAMDQINDRHSNTVLQQSLSHVRTALNAPAQSGSQNPTSPNSKTNVVWCWIDNIPIHKKYKPCILPFFLGPNPPYEYPLTAARTIQAAVDQASEIALKQGRIVPVIVLPSFFPELLRLLSFNICGDDNWEGYEENVQMKPGVVVIGVPLLLEPVKIIAPNDGPAVMATSVFGNATDFEDVLDSLELKLTDIAEDLTTSIINGAASALGDRVSNLLVDGAETGLVNGIDELFSLGGAKEKAFTGFLDDAFDWLDGRVETVASALGIQPIASVASIFDASYADAGKLREDIIAAARKKVSKWLTDSPTGVSPAIKDATGTLLVKALAGKFSSKAKDFLQKQAGNINTKIHSALQASPPVPDATFTQKADAVLKDEILTPVRDQIDKEIQNLASQIDLTFLPDEISEFIYDATNDLVKLIYEDVVVDLAAGLYEDIAKKVNEAQKDLFSQVFDPSTGLNLRGELKTFGTNFGTQIGNSLGDNLEAAIAAVPGSDNVFSKLNTELSFPLDQLGTEALNIIKTVSTQLMVEIASKVLNYGVIFDFEITHKSGKNGPGMLVDGAMLLSIFNTITSNHSTGGLPGRGLPDDGASGGGVVVQGPIPSVFIFNEIEKNSAGQDGGGVYFGDTLGALWVFNTIKKNTAANRAGGTYFDKDAIAGFIFNEVSKNTAQLGGGGYVSAKATLLFANEYKGNRSQTNGGGLAIDGELLLFDNEIDGNYAKKRGGGIAVIAGGEPSFDDNRISGNLGLIDGGGIAVLGLGTNPEIGPSNRIRENFTNGRGGGIFVDGFANPEIERNRIAGNFALIAGGGIYWASPGEIAAKRLTRNLANRPFATASPKRNEISGNAVRNNTTPGHGGGIALIQEFVPLVDNQILNNRAMGEGGGVYIVAVDQASLINNGIGNNHAEGRGGGLRSVQVDQITLRNNWFVGNQTKIDGGGSAIDQGILLSISGDAWEGNYAPQLGGGAWIQSVSGIDVFDGTFLGNRSDGEGGGFYATLIDSIQVTGSTIKLNVADPLGSPHSVMDSQGTQQAGMGWGGGFALNQVGRLILLRSLFDDNAASSHGGGLLCNLVDHVDIRTTTFQNNLADSTLGQGAIHGTIPDPRGGGVLFQKCDDVSVGIPGQGVRFLLNSSDYGGGAAFIQCASARIRASLFEGNTTDTDSDGFGDGGGGIAEGQNTFIVIGGDQLKGEGNTFTNNTAGTPQPLAPRQANGGAFAIEDSAHADIFGNTFQGNACTFTGGALYVSKTVPDTRIGLEPPPAPAVADFTNLAIQNCVQKKTPIIGYEDPPPILTPTPVTLCPGTVPVCDKETSLTDFALTSDSTSLVESRTFTRVRPGPVAIAAVLVPADESNSTIVPSIRISGVEGAVPETDDQVAMLITNFNGEPLSFNVEVSGKDTAGETVPEPTDVATLSLEKVFGNPCEVGTTQFALNLNNLPAGESLLFFQMTIGLSVPDTMFLSNIIQGEFLGELSMTGRSDFQYEVQGFIEGEFTGGTVALLEIQTLSAVESGTRDIPFVLTPGTFVTSTDKTIEVVVSDPDPVFSCPEGVPFIPEKECPPYELWVTVRELDETDMHSGDRIKAGTHTVERTNLLFASIDIDGGNICPPVPVLGSVGTQEEPFEFSAEAGDIADITVSAKIADSNNSIDPEPGILFTSPSGQIMTITDTHPDQNIVQMDQMILPEAGTYTLSVSAPIQSASALVKVEVTINGETVFKKDNCALPTTYGAIQNQTEYDKDKDEIKRFEAAFAVPWPVVSRGKDINGSHSSLPGNANQAIPPWPPQPNWRPNPVLPLKQRDIGFEPVPSPDLPKRKTTNQPPVEIVTFRGGWLGIVDAPSVIADANFVRDNYAEAFGGGAYITQTDSSVQIGTPAFGNEWISNQSLFGGGIAVQKADPILQNNKIGTFDTPNIARFGGGLYLEDSQSLIGGLGNQESNLIHGNVVGVNWIGGTPEPSIPTQFIPTTIPDPQENYVAAGGGAFISGGAPILVNNPILENVVSFQPTETTNTPTHPLSTVLFGGGGIALSGNSSATIRDTLLQDNQIIPLQLNGSESLELEMRGGAFLCDDSIFPVSSLISDGTTVIQNVVIHDHRIRYALEDKGDAKGILSLTMAGAGLAARKAHRVSIQGSTFTDTFIERDYSNGVLDSLPQGKAHGGGISIEDQSQVQLLESKILGSEARTFEETVPSFGGGISIVSASVDIRSNWIMDPRSSHDGGGIYIQSSEGLIDHNTIVGSLAVQRGSGLYIQSPGATSLTLSNNIIESFGAEDSSTVFLDVVPVTPELISATFPIRFVTNNVYAAFSRIYSGSYSDLTGEQGNISEVLRFADPTHFDYGIGKNTTSATAAGGKALGWQPHSLHSLAPPRILVVTDEFSTIQSAINAAQYSDTVLVHSGTYEESLSIPDGIWIRAVSGPLHTIIKSPTPPVSSQDTQKKTVGVQASQVSQRTVFSGFQITGFDIGIQTDTQSGLVIVDSIADKSKNVNPQSLLGQKEPFYAINIAYDSSLIGSGWTPFVAENTVWNSTTGIRIEGIPDIIKERNPLYCKLDIPIPPLRKPPRLPWIHHNASISNLKGIELVGSQGPGKAPPLLPFAHNDVYPDPKKGGTAWVNLPDMTGLHFNIQAAPKFVFNTPIPSARSLLRSDLQLDRRRIGALDYIPMLVLGDLNGDQWFDDLDVLILASLVSGQISESDLPIPLVGPNALFNLTDWDFDGSLTTNDVILASQIFVGVLSPDATPLAAAQKKGGQTP